MLFCVSRQQISRVHLFALLLYRRNSLICPQRVTVHTLHSVSIFKTGQGRISRRFLVPGELAIKNFSYVRNHSRSENMATANCTLINIGNVRQFIDSFDTVLTDCDGVLWNDMESINGSAETIQLMKKLGKQVFYVTNNSGKTREEYAKKCAKLGFPAVKEEIICTAYVTAQYIKNVLKYTGKVYLIGGQGLKQELDNVGIVNFGCGKDNTDIGNMSLMDMASIPLDPEVKCVVAGLDMNFNFAKLQKAQSFLMQPRCHFVGTNTDTCLPLGRGQFFPGTGAIVGSVEIAAGRKATICGKPNKPIFEVLNAQHKVNPARTIMIGDRCNTDMALAHNCGLTGLLVLTGINTLQDVVNLQASCEPEHKLQVPHYYLPRLGDLIDLLKQAEA